MSGGSVWGLSTETEAEASAGFQRLGVPEGRLRLEGDSRNTRENAVFSRMLAAETQRILLVTSASHMRRAQGSFEAVGFTVIPAATDFEATLGGIRCCAGCRATTLWLAIRECSRKRWGCSFTASAAGSKDALPLEDR